MKKRLSLIREALSGETDWPKMARKLRPLTDAELDEVEQTEQMGKRRDNMLRGIRAERARRAGKQRGPQSRMKVSANL